MFIRSAAIQFEKRYGGAVLSCDDYEQEGRIALLHAAERFVPEKGKFLTYAAVVVRTAMLDALRQTHPEINTVSLEENRQTVEEAPSAYFIPSWAVYRKSPEQVYLVTSGVHMRRALLYFKHFGLSPVPIRSAAR